MKETSENAMTAFPPAQEPDFEVDADRDQDLPAPSAKVAELLDVIDAAHISLEELVELTLCNIAELAGIYQDAAEDIENPDEVAYTTAALTRLQISANVLAELLPGDDDGDDELEEGEELEEAA